jgi:hypothetical protein
MKNGDSKTIFVLQDIHISDKENESLSILT